MIVQHNSVKVYVWSKYSISALAEPPQFSSQNQLFRIPRPQGFIYIVRFLWGTPWSLFNPWHWFPCIAIWSLSPKWLTYKSRKCVTGTLVLYSIQKVTHYIFERLSLWRDILRVQSNLWAIIVYFRLGGQRRGWGAGLTGSQRDEKKENALGHLLSLHSCSCSSPFPKVCFENSILPHQNGKHGDCRRAITATDVGAKVQSFVVVISMWPIEMHDKQYRERKLDWLLPFVVSEWW